MFFKKKENKDLNQLKSNLGLLAKGFATSMRDYRTQDALDFAVAKDWMSSEDVNSYKESFSYAWKPSDDPMKQMYHTRLTLALQMCMHNGDRNNKALDQYYDLAIAKLEEPSPEEIVMYMWQQSSEDAKQFSEHKTNF